MVLKLVKISKIKRTSIEESILDIPGSTSKLSGMANCRGMTKLLYMDKKMTNMSQ
jgi:hypothetical protein